MSRKIQIRASEKGSFTSQPKFFRLHQGGQFTDGGGNWSAAGNHKTNVN